MLKSIVFKMATIGIVLSTLALIVGCSKNTEAQDSHPPRKQPDIVIDFPGEFRMECKKVYMSRNRIWGITRCDNDEVYCYLLYGTGFECFEK